MAGRPISRQENLRAVPTAELHNRLIHEYTVPEPWAHSHQQKMFNLAHELTGRNNKNTNQAHDAEEVLWTLAHFYRRTWTNHPASSNINWHMYNSNANSSSPAAVQAPNYSKASAAVKKWLSTRPHTVHMNVVNIKLPANAKDPVSYHNFEPGNEAVMVIKKHLQKNGAMRSRRTFYQKNIIERLAGGKKWRTILRMKGSDPVFRDPLNRRTVYRRDIMNVKFSA
jgi:hypothetical protein